MFAINVLRCEAVRCVELGEHFVELAGDVVRLEVEVKVLLILVERYRTIELQSYPLRRYTLG